MTTADKTVPLQITEDEAAVYDRQIRLWGLEAQQRMRNATIVVMRLKGVATETIKNIVLAGIGKLIVVDNEDVSEEDLGAGFFFRDEDVGNKRVDAAKARVESLNPLVIVETRSQTLSEAELDALVQSVDLVCATDWDRDGLIQVNELCRKWEKPLYAGGTYGLLGYIFCDLLDHDYIAPDRTGTTETPKDVKTTASYPTLKMALNQRISLNRRQSKEVKPAALFAVLALWEYQSRNGELPGAKIGKISDDKNPADELGAIANDLLAQADVDRKVLPTIPKSLIDTLSTTAPHEISPVCAVIGGMLAQDILKALAAREAPIANFFTFEVSAGGTVCQLGMK